MAICFMQAYNLTYILVTVLDMVKRRRYYVHPLIFFPLLDTCVKLTEKREKKGSESLSTL